MQPIPDDGRPFRMTIENIYVLQPLGQDASVVMWGEVESGTLHNHDTVVVTGKDKVLRTSINRVHTVNGPHTRFRSMALLWQNTLQREDLEAGMVVTNQDES